MAKAAAVLVCKKKFGQHATKFAQTFCPFDNYVMQKVFANFSQFLFGEGCVGE
jgi:hypothetical protein